MSVIFHNDGRIVVDGKVFVGPAPEPKKKPAKKEKK